MLDRISSFFEQECKDSALEPILVGVSGGPDSLCLLHLLFRSKRSLIIAHFDHQLRPTSLQEAEGLRELASRMGVNFVTGSQNVRSFASEHGFSLEEAARKLRYDFLFTQARQLGAPVIAVAHHADDQVETILMHFLRGAGLNGLKGMTAVTKLPEFDPDIRLIRPLLETWRWEIEAYCNEFNLEPMQDESNLDQTYFRNRLRHTLIPDLETYNPGFKMTLLRSSRSLAGDQELVNIAVDAAWGKCRVVLSDNFASMDMGALINTSPAILRNIFRRVAIHVRPGIRDVNFEAVERLVQFVKEVKGVSSRINFTDGLFGFSEAGKLYITDDLDHLPLPEWPQVEIESIIKIGKTVLLEGSGWVLKAEEIDIPDLAEIHRNTDPFQVWMDADLVYGKLLIRNRKNGDRFRPLGMQTGKIKVSDLFINEKIPNRARKNFPLVCLDAEILWIPGLRSSHRFRITESTRKCLHLKLSKL